MSAIMAYPEWWDKTITIYNKYEDPESHLITWYRHTVDGCFLQDVGNKLKMGETILESNQIICRIPENELYQDKYTWINNDDRSEYFTLGLQDLVVVGEISEDINEYQKGKRSSDFIAKYKAITSVLEIESLSINTGPMRCNPHYKVRGI